MFEPFLRSRDWQYNAGGGEIREGLLWVDPGSTNDSPAGASLYVVLRPIMVIQA